jgi:hypothetical protein
MKIAAASCPFFRVAQSAGERERGFANSIQLGNSHTYCCDDLSAFKWSFRIDGLQEKVGHKVWVSIDEYCLVCFEFLL